MKTSFFVEYAGKQIEEKDVVAAVKELWVKEGNKVKDMKTLSIYTKPEEQSAYYVINDSVSGKIDL